MDSASKKCNNKSKISKSPLSAQKEVNMYIKKLMIPLNIYTQETTFTVVGQSLVKKYEDGKTVDEIVGAKLELHDDSKKDRFTVKVPTKTLPFTDEEIDNQSIKVTLENAVITPYLTFDKRLDYSIKADGFKVIKKGTITKAE